MEAQQQRGHGLEASWDWLQFAAGLPSRHVTVPGPVPWGVLAKGRSIVTGAALVNSSGAAVTVVIRDGEDASGDIIASLVVPANGGLTWQAPSAGVLAEIGVFAANPGAGITGAVYFTPLWHYPWTPPGK